MLAGSGAGRGGGRQSPAPVDRRNHRPQAGRLRCTAVLRGQRHPCGGVPVEAVDVTGAGDSFSAAFLAACAHGLSDETALQQAVLFSSRKVQFAGTQPAGMTVAL